MHENPVTGSVPPFECVGLLIVQKWAECCCRGALNIVQDYARQGSTEISPSPEQPAMLFSNRNPSIERSATRDGGVMLLKSTVRQSGLVARLLCDLALSIYKG